MSKHKKSFASPFEIPLEAILGDKKYFEDWKVVFKCWFMQQIDSIAGFTPLKYSVIRNEVFHEFKLLTIQFQFPSDSPLYGKPSGGILALPNVVNELWPICIAIHGHEYTEWGTHPNKLFKNLQWPFEMVKAGYVVWAPVSMYHEEIKNVADVHGYIFTWVKIISEGISFLGEWSQAGYVALGLSAGGHIAQSLMAYRADIAQGIFAGADQDLDFLRREYRYKGHPDCLDIEGIRSYTALQSLLAPRPIQFQSGRLDPFFPSGRPLKKEGDWFLGTSRGQLSTEIGGNALVIRQIYELYSARKNFSFHIHDGGHEMKSSEAMKFIEMHMPSR